MVSTHSRTTPVFAVATTLQVAKATGAQILRIATLRVLGINLQVERMRWIFRSCLRPRTSQPFLPQNDNTGEKWRSVAAFIPFLISPTQVVRLLSLNSLLPAVPFKAFFTPAAPPLALAVVNWYLNLWLQGQCSTVVLFLSHVVRLMTVVDWPQSPQVWTGWRLKGKMKNTHCCRCGACHVNSVAVVIWPIFECKLKSTHQMMYLFWCTVHVMFYADW